MVVSILMWLTFSVTVLYIIVIGIITYGWFVNNKHVINNCTEGIKVSIVIAVRNEESNIQKLLQQLVNQNYSSSFYEIIIVNDHSSDNTFQMVNDFAADNPRITIRVINALQNGKKSALKDGIAISDAELIVTTDGDCNLKQGWLSSVVNYYKNSGCKVVLGPVVYSDEKTIWQKLFTLEFVSLVASGAGAASARLPLMGNGANLAFTRDAYNSVKNMGKGDNYASGDDVFLIHSITKKFGARYVGFLQNKDAIVTTLPPSGLSQFFKQRIRWASKSTGYTLLWPIIVTLAVFVFNFILFALLVGSIFYTWMLPIYFLLIFTKFITDSPIVFSFLSFAGKSNLKPLFLLWKERDKLN